MAPNARPAAPRTWRGAVNPLTRPAVVIAVAMWCVANATVLVVADENLPFDWPNQDGSTADHLLGSNIQLLEIFALMALTFLLTRRRTEVDIASRAPERTRALRETTLLLAYGALGLILGALIGRLFGWHPFGLHLAGSVFGTHSHVAPAEAISWAVYNLAVYAVIPMVYFRRRYGATALNLVSTNRRNDLAVITTVLIVESGVQLAALSPALGELAASQYLIGLPLTFLLYFAGTVLPAMVFVYCILVPRYLRLTGSVAATVVLGGLTYTGLHIWDAWTVLSTPSQGALSLSFLFLTYFGPGMMKAVLTMRTGNAWVHVWAYHAIAPHTLIDTPHVVHIFHVR